MLRRISYFPFHRRRLDDVGKRLDQFLAARLESVSRARVQELISEGKVLVNGAAAKASVKLRGGEQISILGSPQTCAA